MTPDIGTLRTTIQSPATTDEEILRIFAPYIEHFFNDAGACMLPNTEDIKAYKELYDLMKVTHPAAAQQSKEMLLAKLSWRDRIRLLAHML